MPRVNTSLASSVAFPAASVPEAHPLVRAGRLLADTAHDLRSPLAATTGLIHLVMEDSDTFISAEQREHLKIAIDRCEEMQRLIDDMLALDRIRSGWPRVIRNVIDVTQLRLSVESLVAKEAQQKEVRIVWRGLDQSAPTIWADGDKLRRWLVNMISNAIRATNSGGRITVYLIDGDRGNMRLGVRDTGSGFGAVDRAQLAQQGRLEREGLGITICRQIAALHHSWLWLNSEPEVGSCFEMFVPLATPVAAASSMCRWRSGTPTIGSRHDGFIPLPIEQAAPRNALMSLQTLTMKGLALSTLDDVDIVLNSEAGLHDQIYRAAPAGWILGWDEEQSQVESRRERVTRMLIAKQPENLSQGEMQWTLLGAYSPLGGNRAAYVEGFVRAALELESPEPIDADRVSSDRSENLWHIGAKGHQDQGDPRVHARLSHEIKQLATHFRARQQKLHALTR